MGTLLAVIQGDITQLKVDAVVNAANTSLLGGGGVDGAIHRAGGTAVLEACRDIRDARGGCKPGEAVITTAGRLPSRYVIHAVGPVWKDGLNNEASLLAGAYRSALELAVNNQARTIAFPNISTGIYGYPKPEAAKVALQTVRDFLESQPGTLAEVIFVCWDPENYHLYTEMLGGENRLV